MVLLLVFLKTVLFSIKNVSLNSANKAKTILVFFKTLLLLTNLGKFIHDNGSNYLIHNHFYDEEVAEVH